MTKFVKYIGTSHVRAILKNEWQAAGVHDQEALIWHKPNGFQVPLSKITDNAWPFIDADPELVVVDVDLPLKPSDNTESAPVDVPTSEGDQATGAVAEAIQQTEDGQTVFVKQ